MKWSADGVACASVFAGVAGVDRFTVAMIAEWRLAARRAGKLKDATAGLSRAMKLTGKLNVAGECTELKKPWLIILQHKLKKIGEAIDAETNSWAAVDGEGDIGFMTVTSVQGGGGECSIGEWFGQSSRLIGSAGELLAKCEDVDDLDWIGLPRVFLESLKVTEKYLIDSVAAICRDLGEILILERPEEADDKPMVAYVEKAEEFLEDARKHDEKRKKRHAEMERFDEYANRVKCAGCPVLVDLCVNHPKEADHLHIMLTIEKDKDNPAPIPKWRVSFFWSKEQDSIGDSGGCLRAILEAKGFPQRTGIELAPCSKFTEGTGMCRTMADAGQEVV